MERNGIVVLTGDVGTGKTTLVNALLGVRAKIISHFRRPDLG
jgi:tRNA A37 threonylcarbamoyladenosine biosynthesis protein TsaE